MGGGPGTSRPGAGLADPTLSYAFAPETLGDSEEKISHAVELSQRLPWPGKRALRGLRAEHEALASRYEHEAKGAQEKGEEAQKTLEWYKRPGNGNYATVKGGLFNQLITWYGKSQEEDLALAERHRQLAAEAPQ